MRRSSAFLAGVVIIAGAVWGTVRLQAAPAASPGVAQACGPLLRLPPAAPVGQQVLFGHIKSLRRTGLRFRMRFDPAWFTSGVTANTAAAEDGAVSPGQPVPNDNYVRDETHRLLTYLVPAGARVTVLTRGTCTTRTTVAKLARSLPPAGFWIRVRIDTVRSIDQQYHP